MKLNHKISDCCGVAPKRIGDIDSTDCGICPSCKEHCEFIDDDEAEEDNRINHDFADEEHDHERENMDAIRSNFLKH